MKQLNYEKIIEDIKNYRPFSFSRWWDFEWMIIQWQDRVSCDNCRTLSWQSESLNKILDSKPEYYLWLQWLAYRLFPEYIDSRIDTNEWYDADVIHHRNISHGLYDLLEVVKESDTLLVWPARMRSMECYKDFVEIPLTDCFLELDRVFNDICNILDKSDRKVILYVAWATSNDLIDMVYNKYGNKFIQLDIGSAFDPYIWVVSREYHKTLDLNNKNEI